jgi:hypothetical protein
MVLLPITPGKPEMRILAVGGGDNENFRCLDPDQPGTDPRGDLRGEHSAVRWELRPPGGGTRKAGRGSPPPGILCDATLLADGTVLVSGGSRTGRGDLNRTPVLNAELFDPTEETIRPAARGRTAGVTTPRRCSNSTARCSSR